MTVSTITRRTAICGVATAATAAAIGPAVAELASGPGGVIDPDAELFARIARLHALYGEAEPINKAEHVFYEQIRESVSPSADMPGVFKVRENDPGLESVAWPRVADIKERGYFTLSDIDDMRERRHIVRTIEGLNPPDHPEAPFAPSGTVDAEALFPRDGETVLYARITETVDSARADRAAELIDAADGWHPTEHPLKTRHAEMAGRADKMQAAITQAEKAVSDTPAMTLAGILAKANLAHEAKCDGLHDDLAESIVEDLARLSALS